MKDLHLDDDFMAALAAQIDADTNPNPIVVLTGTAADRREIRVYEGVALGPTDDAPVRRGFFWVAVDDTEVTTLPSRRVSGGLSGGLVVPGRVLGHDLAVSSISAEDALAQARQKLAA